VALLAEVYRGMARCLGPPRRPHAIREIEAGRLKCRLINRHRRIEFEELMRYQGEQKQRSTSALKRLNDLSGHAACCAIGPAWRRRSPQLLKPRRRPFRTPWFPATSI
jgi:hypothetical protein